MPDLFVPPSKTAPTTEPVIPEEPTPPAEPILIDEVSDDTVDPISEAATPPVEDSLAVEDPVAVDNLLTDLPTTEAPLAANLTADEEAIATAPLELEAVPEAQISADAVPTTVDSLFFYGQTGSGDPTLYEVNLTSGALSSVTTAPDLFPTVLDGLFAAESLAPPLGAEQPATDRVFTLVQGSTSKNFLIGTAADSALLGFSGDDLILTSAGQNLVFGGLGKDTLLGGTGDDGLFGGADDDAMEGGTGDDLLMGGPGNDVLDGGGGTNVLVGGTDADIFRLNTPGAYDTALGGGTSTTTPEPDTLVDFNAAEGDLLDFSLIAAQPLFADLDLLPFLSFVQVGADTQVQVSTPLGQSTTEAILLGVEADTITPANLTFTPPTGLPVLK